MKPAHETSRRNPGLARNPLRAALPASRCRGLAPLVAVLALALLYGGCETAESAASSSGVEPTYGSSSNGGGYTGGSTSNPGTTSGGGGSGVNFNDPTSKVYKNMIPDKATLTAGLKEQEVFQIEKPLPGYEYSWSLSDPLIGELTRHPDFPNHTKYFYKATKFPPQGTTFTQIINVHAKPNNIKDIPYDLSVKVTHETR